MRKIFLAGIVIVIAMGSAVADSPGREPLCPEGRDYADGDSFSISYNNSYWTFDVFVQNGYYLRYPKRSPQGLAKGKIGQLEPDVYLRHPFLEANNPVCWTDAEESTLYGDWKEREVVSFAAEIMVADTDLALFDRPLSLMLVNDSGTPDDETDDCQVFFASGLFTPIPKKTGEETWGSYELLVPSESDGLPQPNRDVTCPAGIDCETCPSRLEACWGVYQFNNCPTKTDHGLTWSTVIQDVDQIRIIYGHPEFPVPEQSWDIGIDNILVYSCERGY